MPTVCFSPLRLCFACFTGNTIAFEGQKIMSVAVLLICRPPGMQGLSEPRIVPCIAHPSIAQGVCWRLDGLATSNPFPTWYV